MSEADLAIQDYLVDQIRRREPGAAIVAEEVGVERARALASEVWVLDPIDGTREFVSPTGSEFCSVVCLLHDGVPAACLVVAPEIGLGASAVTVQVDRDGGPVLVNGKQWPPAAVGPGGGAASVTRKVGSPAPPWEQQLLERGLRPKTRSTSQTLDMVRTSVDLSRVTEAGLEPFAFFYRERQKIWDGVAGMALARAVGHRVVDRSGRELLPVDVDLADLSVPEPYFDSTLVGPAPTVEEFVGQLAAPTGSRPAPG